MQHAFLQKLEQWGNKVPHPSLLFFYLAILMIIISCLCALADVSALHPSTGELIQSKNLLSGEGIRFIFGKAVYNFMNFAPLGVVLVAMLGLGIAERSGLLNHWLLILVSFAKGRSLTFIVAFAGVMSSMAADSGYVLLIPLSALVFMASGRSPLAGIATAFAGVSGGYSANLLIGPIDAVLAGISTSAIQLINTDQAVTATSNWYFNIASTFFIASIVTFITEKLFPEDAAYLEANENTAGDVTFSNKGQIVYLIAFIGLICFLTLPENAALRDPLTGSLSRSPFISSIVVIIALYFAGAGLIFGFNNKQFSSAKDVIEAMENTMALMAGYLVMMFFASQFISYFNWSNLGIITAIQGASFLSSMDMHHYILLVSFIILSGILNIFIGSSSAQWALMAPIFIPVLSLIGIEPEIAQIAYRIGDSSTNIISPMMPYFALVLGFVQQYDKKAGVGTLMAMMLPYSLAFISLWTMLLIIWLSLGLPLGV